MSQSEYNVVLGPLEIDQFRRVWEALALLGLAELSSIGTVFSIVGDPLRAKHWFVRVDLNNAVCAHMDLHNPEKFREEYAAMQHKIDEHLTWQDLIGG